MFKKLNRFFQKPAVKPAVDTRNLVSLPDPKTVIQPQENKSHFGNSSFPHVFDVLSTAGFHQVNMWQAIRYYENIAPISTAIDTITDELISIKPKYITNGVFEDHEVLDLLMNPNAEQTFKEFFKRYSAYYKITGNSFIVATGRTNRPPLELVVVPPQNVSVVSATDGFPASYTSSLGLNGGITDVFNRIEENGRFRYINETEDREIWHVKTFNAAADTFFGKPLLMSIYYELEQYLHASEHNLSLLEKGGRLSGALISKGPLTDEQYQRAKEQVDQTFAGSRNAGRIMIGEGDMTFEEMSSNMKDMDFRNLKKDDQITIYNRLRIPLPLISGEHMTLSNYGEARLALYDNAVVPDGERLYEELTVFLAPRYGWDIKNQGLTFDKSTIQSLQIRTNEEVKLRKEIGVNSVDEQRNLLGDDPLPNGLGKIILVPSSSRDLADEPEEPTDTPKPDDEDEDDKARFTRIMKSFVDIKGNRTYTDEEIKTLSEEQGL